MIILTSSGFQNQAVFDEIKNHFCNKIVNIKSCIITTAAFPEKENNQWIVLSAKQLQKQITELIEFVDLENYDPSALLKFDLIVIAGGNPYNLFYHAQISGAYTILQECHKSGKILVGISAGAMLLSSGIKYISEFNKIMKFNKKKGNIIGVENLEGIKLTNHILFPHYDIYLEKEPSLEMELQKIEKRDNVHIKRLGNSKIIILK